MKSLSKFPGESLSVRQCSFLVDVGVHKSVVSYWRSRYATVTCPSGSQGVQQCSHLVEVSVCNNDILGGNQGEALCTLWSTTFVELSAVQMSIFHKSKLQKSISD